MLIISERKKLGFYQLEIKNLLYFKEENLEDFYLSTQTQSSYISTGWFSC